MASATSPNPLIQRIKDWFGKSSRTQAAAAASIASESVSTPQSTDTEKDKLEDSLELVQVQTVIRHGFRVPLSVTEYLQSLDWKCQRELDKNLVVYKGGEPFDPYEGKDDEPKLGSCYLGQLTILGRQQIREVGRLFRKRYITEKKFLTGELEPNHAHGGELGPPDRDLWIRSTDSRRTIETAWEFTQGLYDSKPNEPVLTTVHVTSQPETMYPNGCPSLSRSLTAFKAQDFMKAHKARVRSFFDVERLSESDAAYFSRYSVPGLCNTLSTIKEHKFALPPGITPDRVAEICEASGEEYRMLYSVSHHARLGIGRFIQQLNDRFHHKVRRDLSIEPTEDFIGMEDVKVQPKFILYSGHDNTIGPLLNALNVPDKMHPSMGSHVVFELYRKPDATSPNDYYVKMLYNMKELALPACDYSVLCPWPKFHQIMHDLTPKNFAEECNL